ncbi:chorismate mutase [Frankia torreyi]|uniref:Chorismate mutase n=1 Tax=Frankia torreyi TaxID=1856 RepID=A0A0D8BLG7_9ACTN|nr:chorismate mutase [Frankia torreyi]KQM07306.1 chorismate mutase [Frankia sp. CpI1-P]
MDNLVDRSDAAIPAPTAPGAILTGAGRAPIAGESLTISNIAEGRQHIDDIDAQLRELLATRRDLSRQIQALRSAEGGPRIEHARENEIIAVWANELGPRGVEIAMAVLTLCRGAAGQS